MADKYKALYYLYYGFGIVYSSSYKVCKPVEGREEDLFQTECLRNLHIL